MTRLFAGTPFDIPPTCDLCGKLESECVCTDEEKADAESARQRAADAIEPAKQTAHIRVEKRKGGRKATVIDGLTAKANDLPGLLTTLQAACGAGGTVKPKEDQIELQGDHTESVRNVLSKIGYRMK
ncbi:translation initiation factor Sui1 [Planctomycetes bacterium CA13]|uniref:Translation initiation factor Sui1 n=1 Tax=Novipirellula herctigrandis TaxID=2527986 RepID=A0A5C5YZJ0_9BACT|nr:translation initiation factor Sui1 [Planctomycetes bacterium CA13]